MAKKAALSYQEEFDAIRAEVGDAGVAAAASTLKAVCDGIGTSVPEWAATPYIINEEQLVSLKKAAQILGSIVEKVMAKYQRDSSFRALFGLDPKIENLTLVPTGRHAAVPLSRVDVVYNQATGDFIISDIMTGGVDGMGASVEISRAVSQTAAARQLADAHGGARTLDPADEAILSILHTYGSWANAQEGRNHPTHPAVAVLDVAGSKRTAETAYIIDRMRDRGCFARTTSFDKLRIAEVGGVRQLVDDNGPITCVWLRATADEAIASGKGLDALVEATRRGLVCTVGGYRSWPCCARTFFEVLRHSECRDLLTDEENAFIDKHIPETTVLSTDTDISDFYDQENWVLRGDDGQGTRGVYAGADLRKQDWRVRLVRGIRRRDAVQAAITPQELSVVSSTGEVSKKNVLLGLYVYEGRIGGLRAICGTGVSAASWKDRMEMGCLVVKE
jgi:hypothetical protein